MSNEVSLGAYNAFCKSIQKGNILYNLDSTNLWGDYLLVTNIATVKVSNIKTYTVFLIGLKKENGEYIPRDLSISLTPSNRGNIPFLKPVGFCKFKLHPTFSKVNIDVGLTTIYGNTDLHKYLTKHDIRKPKVSKYDTNGELIIKSLNN